MVCAKGFGLGIAGVPNAVRSGSQVVADPLTPALIELVGGLLDEATAVGWDGGGLLAAEMLQGGAFPIAQALKRDLAEVEQGEACGRDVAGQDVAVAEDPVDADAATVVEHRLECREGAVDVVEGGYSHGHHAAGGLA